MNTTVETGGENSPPSRYSIFSALLGIFVLLLMVWPIGHAWLMQNYGINPWKGFGIAMYCTRQLVTIEILRPSVKGFENIPLNEMTAAGVDQEYKHFAEYRKTLGTLSGPPPVSLAEKIFVAYPSLQDILFRTRMYRLSAKTGELLPDQKCVYHFHREGSKVALFDQEEEVRLLLGKKR